MHIHPYMHGTINEERAHSSKESHEEYVRELGRREGKGNNVIML